MYNVKGSVTSHMCVKYESLFFHIQMYNQDYSFWDRQTEGLTDKPLLSRKPGGVGDKNMVPACDIIKLTSHADDEFDLIGITGDLNCEFFTGS